MTVVYMISIEDVQIKLDVDVNLSMLVSGSLMLIDVSGDVNAQREN